MNIKTECSQCHRKTGHNRNCPVFLATFVNGERPNVYRLPDGRFTDELTLEK